MTSSHQAIETPPAAREEPVAPPARRSLAAPLDASVAALCAACLALAVVSVLVISWVPSSDPWAWLDWGQEIASSKIPLGLAGGPSWKPFPVFFTSIFGLFGHAQPDLWLVVTRTAGLLALVAAFRLGRRFGGIVAGVVAVLALCFVQDALFYFARGASEPVVAALTLWAIDRHLHGSPLVAYFLAFLATMNRPEFSLFLAAYGAYLWLRVPRSRPLVVALLVLVPIAWFLPPKIITGNAFQAGSAALGGKGSPGTAINELHSSVALMSLPTLVLAAVGLGFAWRRRERVLLWLGAGAIAWAVMVAIMTQVAYGLPRYLLPGGMVAVVLAGYGFVQLAQTAGSWIARRLPAGTAAAGIAGVSWAVIAVGALLVAATLPWSIPRVKSLVLQSGQANQAAYFQHRLFTVVDRVGGSAHVLPCRSSIVAVNHSLASAIAWKLEVPLRRVKPLMRGTGFVFSAPRNRDTGTTPPIENAQLKTVRTIAVLTPWRVFEVTARGASATPHCAPGDARAA